MLDYRDGGWGIVYGYELKLPGKVVCLEGGASEMGRVLERMGVTRALLVTDAGVRAAGLVETGWAG